MFDARGLGCVDIIVEEECQSVVYRYESSMEKLHVGEFLARALVTHCFFISQYSEYEKTWKSIALITRIANKELCSTVCIEFRVDLVAWKMSLDVKETMTRSRRLGKFAGHERDA